jgi:GNAT superfamily N-acetyltransferase
MANKIRQLSIDDYDEIIRIWSFAGLPFKPKGRDSKELMEKEMANANVIYYGMYIDEKLVGVCIGNYDGRRGWINRLAIDPDYRGKNLSAELIEKCEQFLYSIGAKVICALIEDINYPSVTTFKKAGYICEDEIKYFAKRPSKDM